MSQKPKPPFKRVEVAWADAHSVDAWTPVTDLQAMIDQAPEYDDHATGYLVAQNERWVVLANAMSYDAGGDFWQAACSMVVPRGMVLRGTGRAKRER